ncbi:hypothetical protein ACWGII_23320 [Streptomyces sp. NPDC054855]
MGQRAYAHDPAPGVGRALPVLSCSHGADWLFGDDETRDRLFRELAADAGAVCLPLCGRDVTAVRGRRHGSRLPRPGRLRRVPPRRT